MGNEKIDIRDLRDGKFLWIDKATLRIISESAGTMGVAVYSWLCYYANYKAQDCFPSVTTLAYHCGVSRRTIMRAIKQLEELKAVSIERKKGKPNIYKLLNMTRPKSYPQPSSDTDVTSDRPVTGVVTEVSPAVVTPVSPEQEIFNKR
jgi:DNA-binding transcriptional ArsR family regulator